MPQLMKTFTQTINGRYIKLMTRTVCAVKANTLPISLLWFWCLHVTTLAECDAIILFMNIQSEIGKKGNSACDIRSLWKSTLLRDGKQLERCIRLQATPCSFLPVCVCECVCVSQCRGGQLLYSPHIWNESIRMCWVSEQTGMQCVYLQLNTIKVGDVNSRNVNATYPINVYSWLIYSMYQGAVTCM